MAKQTSQFLKMLGDTSRPITDRSTQLVDLLEGARKGDEDSQAVAEELFERMTTASCSEENKKYAQMLKAVLSQLEVSPLRKATFVQMNSIDGSAALHALLIMDNGEWAYVPAHNQPVARKLKLGTPVMIDAQMKILVHPAASAGNTGPEARFERRIDDQHIEVVTHQDEKCVVMVSEEIMAEIKSGKIAPGESIVLGGGGRLGVFAIPAPDGLQHYRYLDRGPVPDIRADRDIGSPPRVIQEVLDHVREEMTRPDLRRKFRLRPCITRLLCGVSGTGKSLSIGAIHRGLYEVMAEITHTSIQNLPPRVFSIKSSQMLSMWFGESDKQVDQFFDEVEQLAGEKFNDFTLPVMVVMEEADGLGRARGQDNVYDRIMTVILQRMDPNREGLAQKLVVFLSTTNTPEIVDPAFLRRIGGMVERFGRLDQRGFTEVLAKHLNGLPLSGKSVIREVALEIFENGDRGVVDLVCQGNNEPIRKFKRDFLTGALIDRAVQQAATEAWQIAREEDPQAAVSAEMVLRALEEQVASVAHQLHPANVHNYLDLPDGVRVAHIRRVRQEA